ncbi:MAG TPA: oxidoreductase, partial [Woeseiaceae bacterium]|nr:oxidoreductase [Woeseiaceae bacterium]
RLDQKDGKVEARFERLDLDDLSEGDVVVKVSHSTINYKDALAATGAGRILRKFPLVGGIDLAGTVVESADKRFSEGDPVLVNGCGLGETRDGGYAEYARLEGDCIVPIPEGMGPREVMQIGTAGFTAALAVHRLQQNGQNPENGPIVVTGATGGVGSIAIDLLDGLGFEVVALTGKQDRSDYLERIGAARILLRSELKMGRRPMEKAEWGGAVDNLGGEPLAWLTRTVRYGGNIASVGLAAGMELNTTVMPFILRAVCLLGINSVETPRDLRLEVWYRLATDLKPRHLDVIGTRTIGFDDLPGFFQGHIDGTVTGRTVVEIAPEP